MRHIWLCADDYGISHAVNAGIRDLIERGRLNATSVMVVAPHFDDADAATLALLGFADRRTQIGLHLTLTAPFKPLSAGFAPLHEGRFLPLQQMLRLSLARRLQRAALAREIAAQLAAFASAFGRMPDFVDGHQHVHLFPQVRDAFLHAVASMAPGAWVRQCGRARAARRLRDTKALTLDLLSAGFRRKAHKAGIAVNPAFAGAYDFNGKAAYAKVFPRFLQGLPDGGLVMCHPGFVDAELKRLDTLTTQREREYDYFISADFAETLKAHDVALAQPGKSIPSP
jgi:predicted glycoside hydrolase/deacetylase ChbG (UPF0249 family)